MITTRKIKTDSEFAALRFNMVEKQIIKRGVTDPSVLDAMRTVPRHLFVPEDYVNNAYDDSPQPIGHGQTISQPYIVASMTEHLELDHNSKVLEIGTGCGYQAAVLAEIADKVYSIEIVPELYNETKTRLEIMHYRNIELKLGDGSLGWKENGPYDAIIITAAAPKAPTELFKQLKPNGRMIAPVGDKDSSIQELVIYHKTGNGIKRESLYSVRFVPMLGKIAQPEAN